MQSVYVAMVLGWCGWCAGLGAAEMSAAMETASWMVAEQAASPPSPAEKTLEAQDKTASKEPQTTPSQKEAPKASEKQEKPAPDPFQVPEGSPEELLKYIEGLRQLEAKDITSREQMIDFLKKLHQAMAEAADKILAAKPTPEQWDKAAQAKAQGLIMLLQLGDPAAEARLTKFAEELHKAGKKEPARQIRAIVLFVQWREMPGPEEKKKHLQKILQFLNEEPVGMGELRLMAGIGQELEFQMPELAVEAYPQFSQLAAKSNLPIAQQLAKRWEAVVRRLQLLGKPIDIQGYTMDGKEFDWKKFHQGKVVLVDFWATWCGWCIKEIPEMKRLYEAYRDRGFEIVGISGDRKREDLEKFLQNTPLPWTIIYGKDGPSPTVDYYGISAWPTMLLVDKTGNVVSLNARGEKLREELKRLLGPIEETQPPTSPDEQKSPKEKTTSSQKRPKSSH